MGIEAIDHLYIETSSFESTKSFWQDLGFKLIEQWGEDEHLACRLESGSTFIILVQAESSVVNVHFRVSNIDSLTKQVETSDFVVMHIPLEKTHWGSRWICIRDPDGHTFGLEEFSSPTYNAL